MGGPCNPLPFHRNESWYPKKKVLISDVHRYVSDVSNVSKMVVTKKWPPPPEQLVSLQRLQEYQVHSPSPLPSHRTQSKVI